MEQTINELVELQKNTINKNAIKCFYELKDLPLESLQSKMEEALITGNLSFISVIGHILEYGTMLADLDNFEKTKLEETIVSRSELERTKRSLELFARLRHFIEPSIIEHPLTKEHQHIENMRTLASNQDRYLGKVIGSYPKSTLWLPTDSERLELTILYSQIKTFKDVDHRLFTERVIPEIEVASNEGYTGVTLDCLQRYLGVKNTTECNLDEEIKNMHLKASRIMIPSAPHTPKDIYLMTSSELAIAQEKYQLLVREIEKYKNPQR